MKWLIALAIAQIMSIGFLGLRVLVIDERTANTAMKVAGAATNNEAAVVKGAPSPDHVTRISGLSAGDVRRIIREELAVLTAGDSAVSNQRAETKAEHGLWTADSMQLDSTVQLKLQNYIARGSIGETEMIDLQMKIARLPPDGRTRALNALTKAMGSGRLKGHF